MPIYGNSTSSDKQIDTSQNANSTSTTTTALNMGDAKSLGFYVDAVSGSHATHVATLRVSADGTNWHETSHTVTGVGNKHDISCLAEWVDIKITTAEGGTSTVNITIIIK